MILLQKRNLRRQEPPALPALPKRKVLPKRRVLPKRNPPRKRVQAAGIPSRVSEIKKVSEGQISPSDIFCFWLLGLLFFLSDFYRFLIVDRKGRQISGVRKETYARASFCGSMVKGLVIFLPPLPLKLQVTGHTCFKEITQNHKAHALEKVL